ncbi:MAG: ATP-binding protein [Pseudomonadota bacterium]|nr:ATP-binding protein [Pseudomonadota bacterium]
MLQSRILWQLWALLGGLLIVSTMVFGWIAAKQLETDARFRLEESLKTQAISLQQLVLPHLRQNTILSDVDLRNLTSGLKHRVTLFNLEGRVLADNRHLAKFMEDYSTRPEIMQAGEKYFGVSERFSETTKENTLYVALRIDQDVKGYVRLAMPLRVIQKQQDPMRTQIFVIAFIIAVFALLISFFITRAIMKPLVKITNTAEQMALGHYELRLSGDKNDEIGKLAAAMNDLAAETETRINDLTNNRNQLETILAGLSEGVIAIDMKCSVMHINKSAQQMLKMESVNAKGQSLHDLKQTLEVAHVAESCLYERILLHTFVKVDQRNIDVSVAPLDGLDNQSIGAVIVLQDITDVLYLEKVRSEFVANASHELKTPISAIRGLVETIIDDSGMKKVMVNTFLSRIKNQAIRLDNIVKDLIQLSRFDAHENIRKNDELDLGNLLKRTYEARLEDAEEGGVALALELPARPIFVKGEVEALGQMITNLIDNGIKYSGDEGQVKLILNKLGQMARIQVADNGMGIPLEEQQRVFERFYRVDRGRSRHQGGTGLGLSIVKHIVTAHQGEITIKSELDKGTIFEILLPATDRVRVDEAGSA